MLNIRTITVSVVIVLALALGAAPVLAASSQYSQRASTTCQTPHALGFEGGALSLLFARDRPTPVADMIRSGLYTFSTVRVKDATYVTYVPNSCL